MIISNRGSEGWPTRFNGAALLRARGPRVTLTLSQRTRLPATQSCRRLLDRIALAALDWTASTFGHRLAEKPSRNIIRPMCSCGKCDCEDKPDKAETVNKLVDLYTHQNTLLWGRLQTLSVLQLPVAAGWYTFWKDCSFDRSLFVASVGVIFTCLIGNLVNCDSGRRNYLRDKLHERAPVLFPKYKKPGLSGFQVMLAILTIIVLMNLAFIYLSVLGIQGSVKP
jgi:hypothetical protein